ncbi:hypothetical protein QFC22_002239 [Naganishia vaughanmartiniae]|uniref:Uncharacterized protein n=1 Tax=Naganishia vaughanmartiniae TaxID=1424756 RepID=A0ACC2XE17_9TREE|nr:hypothetical protein QFC22_002239 [Naganishia vaughanmartiniae]
MTTGLGGSTYPVQEAILELGASTSLPSLLASTLDPPPGLILTTDYPDEQLIK